MGGHPRALCVLSNVAVLIYWNKNVYFFADSSSKQSPASMKEVKTNFHQKNKQHQPNQHQQQHTAANGAGGGGKKHKKPHHNAQHNWCATVCFDLIIPNPAET